MGSLLSTSQSDPEWKSEAKFAMESSCFCVICGSPFDLEGEVYNLDAAAARYKWMRNYRLIGSRVDIHHHNLAGLSKEDFQSACYNTSDSSDVFLSARATWNEGNDQLFHIDGLYPDTNIPYTIAFNAMQQIGQHDTIFPLHEDCLQISRRAIEHSSPVTPDVPTPSSLSILNTMLQNRYRHNAKTTKDSDLIARNDLFDLCTATDINGARSIVGLSLLEWWAGDYEKYYADPVDVPGVSTCILHLLQGTAASTVLQPSYTQPSQASSALEQLPTELLTQISAFLSAYETFALHRVSKALATKLPLSNIFWRESILSGNGLPYLWDLDVEWLAKRRQEEVTSTASSGSTTWDWKAIGQLLATKHFPLKSSDPRSTDLPNGVWNRRRIWSIVEQAYRRDFSTTSMRGPTKSVFEPRKRREPVYYWQLEEIMDDLGHYS